MERAGWERRGDGRMSPGVKQMEENKEEIRTEAGKPEEKAVESRPEKAFKEITLHFGKGCVGEPFQAKDGKEYCQILVPNPDKDDKKPWQTFVVRSNQVHDNKFGKGMWCKLPAEGHTTLLRSVVDGKDENDRPVWKDIRTKVPNRELKKMVEAYKQNSLQETISKKQEKTEKAKSAPEHHGKVKEER